ncbi:hypothetical protein [Marivirga arenosa]|uniref:Uncharacterized protein n=1 Tax=Marivirga arenosa TaxID=3059076 RepID=A0AA49GEQ6_9BACT|nr:hypothetical protein [Marivirga sp. BKB1-2]WKK82296.2 hypothetical protein QYS47_09420 [Marivirga sp. BKB1-2]
MQKIDYGDVNKFLVSIGLVLIGLAILAPYLYLKEDFGIYITKEQLLKFEEPIKNLIINKQFQITKIQRLVPWASLGLLILGLTSSIIGLVRWFKRQAKIDEKFDKEIQKLDLEIESLTPEEKIEKAKNEVQEIQLAEQLEFEDTQSNISHSSNKPYLDYMKIENQLYNLFKNLKSPNFEIYSEQKLGGIFNIDMLLKANTNKFSDRLIEIKYYKNKLPVISIQKSLDQLNTYISYYKKTTNKRVIPILLIVYNSENNSDDIIHSCGDRINKYSTDIPNLQRLKVEFIPEHELQSFNVSKLLKR